MIQSDCSAKDKTNGRWTREEHEKFLLGLQLYGKNWKKIEEMIVTRNGSQIRSHAQKFFLKKNGQDHKNQENIENRPPETSNNPNKTSKKKKEGKSTVKLPEINAPNFWTEMSELLSHEKMGFWDLIDDCQTGNISKITKKKSFTVYIGKEGLKEGKIGCLNCVEDSGMEMREREVESKQIFEN